MEFGFEDPLSCSSSWWEDLPSTTLSQRVWMAREYQAEKLDERNSSDVCWKSDALVGLRVAAGPRRNLASNRRRHQNRHGGMDSQGRTHANNHT